MNTSNINFKKTEAKETDKQSVRSHSSLNSLTSLKRRFDQIDKSDVLRPIVKEVPAYDSQKDYYQLYWTAFIENQVLLEQLKKKSEERNNYLRNIMRVNTSQCSQSIQEEKRDSRKKHIRRTAKEISKDDKCPYAGCGKHYGSEGSLNLHMKLKHDGGNKTDREKLAKSLVIAYTNGKSYPEVTLNLPPGAVEEEAKKLNIDLSRIQVSEIQKIAEKAFEAYSNKI